MTNTRDIVLVDLINTDPVQDAKTLVTARRMIKSHPDTYVYVLTSDKNNKIPDPIVAAFPPEFLVRSFERGERAKIDVSKNGSHFYVLPPRSYDTKSMGPVIAASLKMHGVEEAKIHITSDQTTGMRQYLALTHALEQIGIDTTTHIIPDRADRPHFTLAPKGLGGPRT